jgi:hypothetical protein
MPMPMVVQVWPAVSQDGNALNNYKGLNPMGTLAAIPSTVDISALTLTAAGRTLAIALQDYGIYIVDQDGSSLGLYAEPSLAVQAPQMLTDMRNDLRLHLISYLTPVMNNGPTSVGGGGTPLASLAPPFLAVSVRHHDSKAPVERVCVCVKILARGLAVVDFLEQCTVDNCASSVEQRCAVDNEREHRQRLVQISAVGYCRHRLRRRGCCSCGRRGSHYLRLEKLGHTHIFRRSKQVGGPQTTPHKSLDAFMALANGTKSHI